MRTTRRKGKVAVPNFFAERGISEGYLVMRVDDYAKTPNKRGGFAPAYAEYMGKGGMLWPNQSLAEKAAAWVLEKPESKGKMYAVVKVVSLISAKPVVFPVIVEKV